MIQSYKYLIPEALGTGFGGGGLVVLADLFDDLRLFQNDVVIDPAASITQFTVATFSGYTTDVTAWAGPFLDEDGNFHKVRNALFSHNGGGTANTIYGWYATYNDGNGGVWIAEKWDTPIGMGALGDMVSFLAELKIAPPFGASPPNG